MYSKSFIKISNNWWNITSKFQKKNKITWKTWKSIKTNQKFSPFDTKWRKFLFFFNICSQVKSKNLNNPIHAEVSKIMKEELEILSQKWKNWTQKEIPLRQMFQNYQIFWTPHHQHLHWISGSKNIFLQWKTSRMAKTVRGKFRQNKRLNSTDWNSEEYLWNVFILNMTFSGIEVPLFLKQKTKVKSKTIFSRLGSQRSQNSHLSDDDECPLARNDSPKSKITENFFPLMLNWVGSRSQSIIIKQKRFFCKTSSTKTRWGI